MQEEKREEYKNLEPDGRVPLILEEEAAEAGDRPNTCRACAGSPFC